jgi:hypothetical protein
VLSAPEFTVGSLGHSTCTCQTSRNSSVRPPVSYPALVLLGARRLLVIDASTSHAVGSTRSCNKESVQYTRRHASFPPSSRFLRSQSDKNRFVTHERETQSHSDVRCRHQLRDRCKPVGGRSLCDGIGRCEFLLIHQKRA